MRNPDELRSRPSRISTNLRAAKGAYRLMESAISDEQVRARAYAIWEQEGRPEGKSLDHWLQAEAEIRGNKIIGVTDNGRILRFSQLRGGVGG